MQKKEYEDDVLMLGGHPFHSRFILGSGKFSLSLIQTVMEYGGSEIATIALRRANADSKENILDFLPKNITLLPNTSGARNAVGFPIDNCSTGFFMHHKSDSFLK